MQFIRKRLLLISLTTAALLGHAAPGLAAPRGYDGLDRCAVGAVYTIREGTLGTQDANAWPLIGQYWNFTQNRPATMRLAGTLIANGTFEYVPPCRVRLLGVWALPNGPRVALVRVLATGRAVQVLYYTLY